jgi:hypothetical protein
LQSWDPRADPLLDPKPDPSATYDLNALDRAARLAHEAGLYPVAVVLKWFVREVKRARGYPDDELKETLRLEIASLAGVRHRWVYPLTPAGLRSGDIGLAYHYGNYLSNRGEMSSARMFVDIADGMREDAAPSRRGDYEVDAALRHAQVGRTPRQTELALKTTSGGDVYRQHTALVIAFAADLQRGDLRLARARAEALPDATSWLYRAERWFTIGCTELLLRRGRIAEVRRAYMNLVRAQYVYVVLGLQGPPHIGILDLFGAPDRPDALPSDVLATAEQLGDLTPRECLELRRLAILADRPLSLQDQLLRTLRGWQSPLSPPALT